MQDALDLLQVSASGIAAQAQSVALEYLSSARVDALAQAKVCDALEAAHQRFALRQG